MKSLTAVCQSGASAMPAINSSGRISRQNNNHHHHHNHRDGENAEMKMYLSKLKDLVPFMPKNRKLSKLEIIQHVIDYICDLQSELETHPDINNFDAATALSLANGNHHHHQISSSHLDDEDMSMEDRLAAHLQNSASSVQIRQPLATRQSPNTILNSSQNNSVINSVILSNSQAAVQQQQQHQQQQHQQQQYSHATTLIAPAAASTEKQTADNKNSRQHC